jgi:phosphatidylglycerol:prolipoprotein diacylglycerol transferase
LHPDILNLGPLHLRAYGLMLAIAFLAAVGLAAREGRHRGLDLDRLLDLCLVVIASGVAGARLVYVLTHVGEFQGRWHEVLYVWQGGLTLWGGFLLAVPAGMLYCVRRRLNTWVAADVLAGPVAVASAIGRLGCFLNGCCYGVPTSLPWGVRFPAGSLPYAQFDDAALHPSQLYNVLAGLLTYAATMIAAPRLRAPGQRWWLMLGIYAVLRAVVDLSRYYEPAAVMGRLGALELTESQVVGVALALISLAFFVALGRRAAAAAPAGESAAAASQAG